MFLKPDLNNVIVDVPVTLECYTNENIYSFLSFGFSDPQNVDASSSSVTDIPGGGIGRNTTFTITAALNGTKVFCFASGTGSEPSSQSTTIFTRGAMDDFHYCRLPGHLFFNWTSVFTLNGFVIQYKITDNHQNKTIDVPHYSVPLRSESYQANITVVVKTAGSQVVQAYGESKQINLSGM